jgi:hypothetical protein
MEPITWEGFLTRIAGGESPANDMISLRLVYQVRRACVWRSEP